MSSSSNPRDGARPSGALRALSLRAAAVFALCLFPLSLGACKAVDKNFATADGDECDPGEPQDCTCSDGRLATRVCLPEGGFSPCACDVDQPRCAAGTESACDCPDGSTGAAVCLSDGTLSACRCPDPVSTAGNDGSDGAGGTGGTGGTGGAVTSCCKGQGSCIAEDIIPEDQRGFLGVDSCDAAAGEVCAPDALSNPAGFTLQPCRSSGNAEGRCLPDCLPQVAEQANLLPRDLCPPNNVCAPCYDPFSGTDTTLCRLSNDPGPSEPPLVFDRCCEGTGTCLPSSLLPADQRDFLGQDSCDAGQLCGPDTLSDPDGNFALASCTAPGDAEGRCTPSCLPQVEEQAQFLSQADCGDVEVCSPCFDPISGTETGICSLGDDPGPSSDPVIWEGCCETDGETLGTCVPAELLPPEQADNIPQESCPRSDQRCAPNESFEDPDAALTPCSSLLVQGGICVLECLVTGLGALLPQGDCEDGRRCVPQG